MIHTTVSGHHIAYDEPIGELARFLGRMHDMRDDPKVTEAEMVLLYYSKANPLLDPTIFANRGAVTKEVLAKPLHHVLVDYIDCKHVREAEIDVEQVASAHTISVSEAAKQLGIHESAVRQAIAARRLASWVKTVNGTERYFIRQEALDAFALTIGSHGPRRETTPTRGTFLAALIGDDQDVTLRVQVTGSTFVETERHERIHAGHIEPGWTEVHVFSSTFTGAAKQDHYQRLVPGHRKNIFAAGGALYVSGMFEVVEKLYSVAARRCWDQATPRSGQV